MKSYFSSARELLQSVVEVLDQGETLLARLTDEAYTHKVTVAFGSSIGSHYRHCLDHFRTLLDAAEHGHVNYDHRERGTPVECDRFAALNATRDLREHYASLDAESLALPLYVTSKTCLDTKDSQTAISTVGREIMYSVAHAGHHYALIRVMCAIAGFNLPAEFGVAPSTLQHHAGAGRPACGTFSSLSSELPIQAA